MASICCFVIYSLLHCVGSGDARWLIWACFLWNGIREMFAQNMNESSQVLLILTVKFSGSVSGRFEIERKWKQTNSRSVEESETRVSSPALRDARSWLKTRWIYIQRVIDSRRLVGLAFKADAGEHTPVRSNTSVEPVTTALHAVSSNCLILNPITHLCTCLSWLVLPFMQDVKFMRRPSRQSSWQCGEACSCGRNGTRWCTAGNIAYIKVNFFEGTVVAWKG